MLRSEFGKDLADRSPFPFSRFLEPLTDASPRVGASRKVEQPLVCLRVLYDRLPFAFDRQHDGALTLLKLLHEIAGAAPKHRESIRFFLFTY